ncbi:CocE/NonD family hydrolase [Pendulispora brunnea]|uniref:CocE/NonD family hydrolase n=1 Tax=Pendulispora brunnea TaxID=2905690 RepID=A0ABZ2K0C2_9BACT
MNAVLDFDVEVPARDGARLACHVARPAGEGRWPVIIARTPYGKDGAFTNPVLDPVGFAREGFAVVVQDVRKRDGFTPFVHEADDGEDLVAWAAAQPFSTGDVFANGNSYQGFAQWAAATRAPPALRAIAPGQSPSIPSRTMFHRGGVFERGAITTWSMSLGLPQPFEPSPPMLQAFTEAQSYERIVVPALIIGGWYDYFVQGAIDQFVGMRTRAGSERARQRTRLVMGPWTHTGHSAIAGERYLGFGALPGIGLPGGFRGEIARFFREQLAGAPATGAPVRIFVMGSNVWRDESEWPIARTQYTSWYLGAGSLGPEPRWSAPARIAYDPASPVPTWGGSNIGFTELAGPRDQRRIEVRDDVLVYTSAVLDESLEVTGTVVVELWATSSAPEADFVIKLVDVEPDGTTYNVAEGILRLALEPGQPRLFRIELTPTSHAFQPGHRVQLDVTSSSSPRWALNPHAAEHHVLHEQAHPSRVILPIVPLP